MHKKDVLRFATRLEDNLFTLHESLRVGIYCHDSYENFFVHDPKRRFISKATVKDRVVHQAVVQVIEPLFEKQFIFDSYASRCGKGTHAAVERLEQFLRRATNNYRHKVYVLKCDVRKFFDSVSHARLTSLIGKKINDQRLQGLISQIITSYAVDTQKTRGLPLGNVTSQLFANVYLDGLDHFIKEHLRTPWYLRFCDDFILVHSEHRILENSLSCIKAFLMRECALTLHSQKVSIRKVSCGVDFLGWVLRPYYRIPRTTTRRRLMHHVSVTVGEYVEGVLSNDALRASLQSYRGILKHGETYRLETELQNEVARGLKLFNV